MAKRRDSRRHQRGGESESAGAPAGVERPRRWPLVLAIIACVAVGAVVLERLSRPPDEPADRNAPASPEPSDPAAMLQRALAEASSSLPETVEQLKATAQNAAERLAKEYPQSAEPLALKGRVLLRFGNSAKALECWEECLRRDPKSADAHSLIGSLAWEQGDYEKAVNCLQKTLALNPELTNMYIILAESLMNLGRPKDAAAVLEGASHRNLPVSERLVTLGQAYTQLGRYEKARECYESVVAANPKLKNAHYGLAVVFQRLGQPEKAKEHREIFLKLKSQEWEVENRARAGPPTVNLQEIRTSVAGFLFTAGNICRTYGNLDQAEKYWLTAAALDPENSTYRGLLIQYYSQRGGGPAPAHRPPRGSASMTP